MSDNELLKLVATIWVAHGGDAEGLDYCHGKLKQAIQDAWDLQHGDK